MEFEGLKAAGPDGIRPISIMLQKGLPLISRAYADIAKASFKSGHVPLKWMERVVLWHMEVDLKIYSKLN
jgi:hypothetical protein